MGHTYAANFLHCVFSTKGRRKTLTPEMQSRLEPYLAGIARANGFKILAARAVHDHAHILLSLPPSVALAKAMQLVKGGSSKWIHDTFPETQGFGWQEGYGAFSIGVSGLQTTIAYIERQEEHHRERDFETEFIAFLKKHGIEYDERYVFG